MAMPRFALLLAISSLMLHSCVSTGKLRDGDTAFRLGKYQVAAEMLREEYNGNKNPATRSLQAYRIGLSYDAMNRPESSAQWFAKAYEDGYGLDALYEQSRQLKKQERYEEAIEVLKLFMQEEPDRRAEVRREVAVLEQIQEQLRSDAYYEVQNLGAINSLAEDFAPVLFEGGALVFTSGRSSAIGEGDNQWTGSKYYDLFSAQPKPGGGYYDPAPFDLQINGLFYEGTATFTADFSEMVYTQCGSADKKVDDACQLIYRFREVDGSWSEPEVLQLFSDSVNIGHPAYAPDGKRLFFSASGDPDSYGGADIYYVRQVEGGWSQPINLGPSINTTGNEVFPYLAPDGSLYFSSDGHPGMGGLDIFNTTETRKVWSRPEPMGYPVNSGADDFGVLIFERENPHPDTLLHGLFSSSRAGGSGMDDLYRFILRKRPPPPPRYELIGDIVEKVLSDPKNPDSEVTGYRALNKASVELYDLSSGISQGVLELDAEGRFSAQLNYATEYRVSGSLSKYFSRAESLSTEGLPRTAGDTFRVETRIVLEPITERDITLRNIYYDFDDTTLRSESFPELEILIKILRENPLLRVEIGSHTDSRGRTEYNDILSRGRANSVVAYLVSKGISGQRMEARGYGERRLLNRCADGVDCTEDEHQLNRRTTFKVIGEMDLESEQPDQVPTDPRRRNR